MFSRSLRRESVVLLSALLFACGGGDDGPGSSNNGGEGGEDTAGTAGTSGSAGSGGTKNTAGTANTGGDPEGGTGQGEAGMPSEAGGSGEGGEPTMGGEPPTLEGDGIAWTWNGKTYTANKDPHNGFFPAVERVNISVADTEDDVPPNRFTLHLMPDKVGTFDCKDYVTATDSSFGIVWQTFDSTMNPPNPGFGYDPALPCKLIITRADKGETSGDVFEGTFEVSLRFPGNGVYEPQDRTGIVGRMRITKP